MKATIRKNDPTNTRGRVLDAAAGLFSRKGYADTSMQDIMAAAGVTSGALHHHYSTKKQLGLAVINERVAATVEEAWIDPVRNAATAEAGVRKAMTDIIADLKEGSIAGCPLNNLALELAYAEPQFGSALQPIFDRWTQVLARQIGATGFALAGPAATAEEMATLVIAAYSGAMTMAKTGQSVQPLKAALKLLTRLLEPAPSIGPADA
ncbi:TetR/AcrR family transcriptional regulator [Sphingomonas sp.]|uniref:TetR/AcrR family transcriptional regulator n=1 Tax=Sphingomonas sp. TaxID=28214 RepID=UPI0025EB51BD|nr:TetR/AcrR family transcriptional regulator [Sphingomonas sp.]MBV9527940.1 TetR/AcrR family transcriptional regulator [Sphingomonas sp.]